MTATIIPFPINPRAARADVFRPEWTASANAIPVAFNTPLRHDGLPLREGDRVLVRHPKTGSKREGVIMSKGMDGCYSPHPTLLILLTDGARHLTRTEYVECARAHEMSQARA